MRTQPPSHGLWILVQLLLLFTFAASFNDFGLIDESSSIVYSYNRIAEIEKQCSSLLSLASELNPDDSRGYRLKNELSLWNGDWEQENGGSPLMPFDESDLTRTISISSSYDSPFKLVSFKVTDVNPTHQLKDAASLSGIMSIGITRNSSFGHDLRLKYDMRPGVSVLTIVFEGVYIETEENGGEQLLCMLGNTTLPSWKLFDDFSDSPNSYWSNFNREPRPLQDDQILLLLRYPQSQTFNLTRRAIRGQMRSLNEHGSVKYFDQVYISSQLGQYSKYKFSTKRLQSRTCDPSLYQNELMEDGANMFNGSEFCNKLRCLSMETFSVVPNWNFNDKDKYHGKLGPFLLGKTADSSYENVKLIMTRLHCEQISGEDESITAKVSAVFRTIPSSIEKSFADSMTGLSGTTLTAEGLWSSSSGQLCMVGCIGVVDSGLEGCDSQIALYFPRAFSIKQRSIILGSISSIKNETDSFFPLLFQAIIRPVLLESNLGRQSTYYLSYNHSKNDLVRTVREKSQPSKLETIVKRALLRYPAIEKDGDNLLSHLNRLSDDLYFDAYANPNYLSDGDIQKIFIRTEVLSVGPLFGRYDSWSYGHSSNASAEYKITNYQLLNVSLHFMFTKAPLEFSETIYRNISVLFLEGIYDTVVGQMYLIGCRKVMGESNGTERGLDCMIEAKIEYPSETLRWLINPTVKITITSQRNEDDPLHFSPISLRTLMIRSDRHQQNVFVRKTFEGFLRVVMLCVEIMLIFSQLFYIKKKEDAIPYVSLVMLGIQVHEHILPLISNTEILFRSKESESYRSHPYDHYEYQLFSTALEYIAKLLLLIVFLLLLRLVDKVSASRSSKHASSSRPSKPGGINDKQVFRISLIIYSFSYMVLVVVRSKLLQPTKDVYFSLTEYISLAYEFFLLPQIIGTILWKIQVKPLKKIYYIGFTLVRIILHLYDHARDPVSDPYSEQFESENLRSQKTFECAPLAIVIAMVMLAVVVYVQQRSTHQKLANH